MSQSGINRDQMPYAQRMYMQMVHAELEKWWSGISLFSRILQFLQECGANTLKSTYHLNFMSNLRKPIPTVIIEKPWTAIFTACDLFRNIAKYVAMHLGYPYNQQDDEGIMRYLEIMRN